ncbi:DUF2805 domain-containing protein [Polaromonas sp.]|uniref:DUF2805 domain-containing protein n=1 Tax=Polaromonas sp. TaxID=1869339 RepID=UPI0013B690ED|nr:DUF2805 domain-containing protein [Polaromonas sp.]NDP61721.1 TIGR03643 family protein [Polaromonas sp.]
MLSDVNVSRRVESARENRTLFEAIEAQFELNESGAATLMRSHMKASPFPMWHKRMAGQVTKHRAQHRGQSNSHH